MKLSLLIVDDEYSIRNGLSKSFDWNSYDIDIIGTASDGEEALSMIKELTPDMVITDIRMPKLDGLSLIEKVKEAGLKTAFIIISGYEDFQYAKRAMHFQVTSYILKPINRNELLESVCSMRDILLKQQEEYTSYQKTKEQLNTRKRAMKDIFFSRLIMHEYRLESEVMNQLQMLQIKLSNTPSKVFIVSFSQENLAQNTDESLHEFQNHSIEIIEEILCQETGAAFIWNTDTIAAIINCSPTLTEKELRSRCFQIIEKLEHLANTQVYIGIGLTEPVILSANTSFQSAKEALTYRIYETPQKIFEAYALNLTQKAPAVPQKKNEELIDAIYRNDRREMDRLLHSFFHNLFYTETPPPSYIRGMCIYLILDIQYGLKAYIDNQHEIFTEAPFEIINRLPSFRKIRAWITEQCHAYGNYIQEHCIHQKDPILQKTFAYLQENIYRKIKAEDVATLVGLSENYFTVYFKEKTGENFKSYIQKMKMDSACEHLKTSKIGISELSSLLGYKDYRSFNRMFKKEMGMTPSEYQQRYTLKGKK